MFKGFYNGKKVLVTGHTGFKGSWLSLWLSELEANVAGFSAYLPSSPCNFEVLGLERLLKHIEGDVRNFDQIKRAFDSFQPEIVFHLAGQPIVRRSYSEPKKTFETNVMGTVNVLECIRQSDRVNVSVMITSDKCYRNLEWVWGYREDDQLGGGDPYSASKGCAEMVINAYWQSFFERGNKVKVGSTRAGNVIGGGDWGEDRIVPDCVRAWAQSEPVNIRNPHATRPWQFVLEPLSGYLWLGALMGTGDLRGGGAFNFGPKDNVIQPVDSLIEAFQKYWEGAKWQLKEGNSMKKESSLLKLCCDKALACLNWQSILSFEETVEFTASWYRNFYQQDANILTYSRRQIEEYCSLGKERRMGWAEREER